MRTSKILQNTIVFLLCLSFVSAAAPWSFFESQPDYFSDMDGTNGIADLTGNYSPSSFGTVTCTGNSCNFGAGSNIWTGFDPSIGTDQLVQFCWGQQPTWTTTPTHHLFGAFGGGQYGQAIYLSDAGNITRFRIYTTTTNANSDNGGVDASKFTFYAWKYDGSNLYKWTGSTSSSVGITGNLDSGINNHSIGSASNGVSYWKGNISRCLFTTHNVSLFNQTVVDYIVGQGMEASTYKNLFGNSSTQMELKIQDQYDSFYIANFTASITNNMGNFNISTTNGSVFFGRNETINISIFSISENNLTITHFNATFLDYDSSIDLTAKVIPEFDVRSITYTNFTIFGNANYTRVLDISLNMTCVNGSNSTLYLYVNNTVTKTQSVTCQNNISLAINTNLQSNFEGNFSVGLTANNSNYSENNKSYQYFSWDLYNPNAFVTYDTTLFNPLLNMTLNCTDNLMNQTQYNMSINMISLRLQNLSNASLAYNHTTLNNASNIVSGVCSDLFGSSTNTTTVTAFFANLTLINEQTGLPFDVSNLTTAKLYMSDLNSFDLKAAGTGNVSFGSLNTSSIWLELSNDGGTIIRYFDVSLFDGSIKICANYNTELHYEQLFIAATQKPVYVRNTFSNCYIVGEYTQFAYQDALSVRGFTIEGLYDLTTISNGQKVTLASIDGGLSTYRNLDTLEFSQNAYSYSIESEYVTFQKYGNSTIQIYYRNQANDSTALTLKVYDVSTSTLLYTKSDFTDFNQFTFYWDYSIYPTTNASLFKFNFIRTDSTGTDYTLTRFTSKVGSAGVYPAAVGIMLSLLLFLISLTTMNSKLTFGWFGILGMLAAIVLLSLASQTWYTGLLQAFYWITLVTLALIYVSANKRGVLSNG